MTLFEQPQTNGTPPPPKRLSISDIDNYDQVIVASNIPGNKSWRGEIEERVEGSRTMLMVKDIDRGPGWDENTQSYKGVRTANGWYLGRNYDYGTIHPVHINRITKSGE